MAQNTIIGQAARGSDFFPRPQITNEIWEKIESGSNLLLVAPRRVGKSSILFNLLDDPRENRLVIYYTSESVNNENEFYKKLYHHITDKISGIQKYWAKTQSGVKDFLSRVESVNIKGGVELGTSKISYLDELNNLIKKLEIDDDRIIVLVDEFAQTVENILQDENEKAAIHFLESNREIRQAPEIYRKLQFIYAGSIGLENIVSRINGINTINDLASIQIPPLNRKEVDSLINNLLNATGIEFDKGAYDHLLNKIEWWIPFYFQLILDDIKRILTDTNSKIITQLIINQAIEKALSQRIYFEQWFTRLRKAFKGNEFSFVKELLNIISIKLTISVVEIVNLSIKYHVESIYKELLNVLKHDGYINNNDDSKIYRFNSPLLRDWWKNNVAD